MEQLILLIKNRILDNNIEIEKLEKILYAKGKNEFYRIDGILFSLRKENEFLKTLVYEAKK